MACERLTDAAREQWDVRCLLCGKPGHQHNSATRACPIGRKHRTFGYSSFHRINKFTDSRAGGWENGRTSGGDLNDGGQQ